MCKEFLIIVAYVNSVMFFARTWDTTYDPLHPLTVGEIYLIVKMGLFDLAPLFLTPVR